jgi:hypothetical protein
LIKHPKTISIKLSRFRKMVPIGAVFVKRAPLGTVLLEQLYLESFLKQLKIELFLLKDQQKRAQKPGFL